MNYAKMAHAGVFILSFQRIFLNGTRFELIMPKEKTFTKKI